MDELSQFIHSNPDARELKRALAVQMVQQRHKHRQIQSVLQVCSAFISKWNRLYKQQGVAGLRLRYQGSQPYLNAKQHQQVLAWLEEKNYWNLEELQTYLEVDYDIVFQSKQSYYDLFTQAGISWKKNQRSNPKKDPEQVKKNMKSSIG
jgi:putative transposase